MGGGVDVEKLFLWKRKRRAGQRRDTMSGLPSLNAGITAAWNTNAPPQKKRTRRAIPLNDLPAPASPLDDSPAPATPAAPPRRKRPRAAPSVIAAKYAPPDLDLGALGGLQPQITQLLEIAALALFHPEIYLHTGVPRPKGVLLHGVPGGGKTQLVRCLAGVSLPMPAPRTETLTAQCRS